MAHCYRCGRPIPPDKNQQRRKVRTGETLRLRRRDDPRPAVTVRFGPRVVCRRCAREIDRERRWPELMQYAELALALLVLAYLVLSRLL